MRRARAGRPACATNLVAHRFARLESQRLSAYPLQTYATTLKMAGSVRPVYHPPPFRPCHYEPANSMCFAEQGVRRERWRVRSSNAVRAVEAQRSPRRQGAKRTQRSRTECKTQDPSPIQIHLMITLTHCTCTCARMALARQGVAQHVVASSADQTRT